MVGAKGGCRGWWGREEGCERPGVRIAAHSPVRHFAKRLAGWRVRPEEEDVRLVFARQSSLLRALADEWGMEGVVTGRRA
ncbi:hypothetical protein E2562_027239 [Oryza meyeriana var. granulata]|uniref:Uncharacterized protein n=1 Tax=Oryza meyeriana var. granulata TaxID=110450 RepID=A0A6G1D960_9ORYZ|nr:hypothetical protein E2562_027239 [Oryza meyeriana var. granulata]